MVDAKQAPFRQVNIANWDVDVRRERDGSIYLRPLLPLGSYPTKLTERLDEWATRTPENVFLAMRGPDGDWRKLTYAAFRDAARSIAQALLDRGVSTERPVAVLSGNDFEHALIQFGAMYAGILYTPVSPAYSLLSTDFGKLRQVMKILSPGLIFAGDGAKFARAIDAVIPPDMRIVVAANPVPGRPCEFFSDLAATKATRAVDDAHDRVTGDTIAKILFTSGSAGVPKGVINTQRMLCSNQQMLATVFPFFTEAPPVICDWMPWHHTFGGNHDIGLALYNGGSFYIDCGKATPGLFDETLKNLSEIPTTAYFAVPKTWEMLARALRADSRLRKTYFSKIKMNFYAAASLPQHVWDDLEQIAVDECGERIRMITGLGMTETAPFAISTSTGTGRASYIGLPVPGTEIRLAPVAGKMEVRYCGPNVTPGFWRQEELTRAAFDEAGFYRSGDAALFLNPVSPHEGLVFNGRLAEDFKLSTGTWVSVGPLRARFIAHFAPYVRDVVIAGHDRDEITGIVIPDAEACRTIAEKEGGIPAVFGLLLASFCQMAAASSHRVDRLAILQESPSMDAGEVTDKGSINQRAVLKHRPELIEDLYRTPPPSHVIVARSMAHSARAEENR